MKLFRRYTQGFQAGVRTENDRIIRRLDSTREAILRWKDDETRKTALITLDNIRDQITR